MKTISKPALTETLHEQQALPRGVFAEVMEAEVMEEVALARAIAEGSQSEPVTRAAIFHLLDSGE